MVGLGNGGQCVGISENGSSHARTGAGRAGACSVLDALRRAAPRRHTGMGYRESAARFEQRVQKTERLRAPVSSRASCSPFISPTVLWGRRFPNEPKVWLGHEA